MLTKNASSTTTPNVASSRTPEQVAASAHLLSLPPVANQLLSLARQSDPDFAEMAAVIRCDPAVSGKLLTTVNSALFGFRHKTSSVEEAIPKLGASVVRTLILGFHLGSFHASHEVVEKLLPRLWKSKLTQGSIAELIAEHIGLDSPRCFLAGMVQDVGILALVSEYPEEYAEHVLSRCDFPDVTAAEQSHFGFNHIDVSMEITAGWHLGDDFCDALWHHHDRFGETCEVESPERKPLRSVLQAAHLGTGILMECESRSAMHTSQMAVWQDFLEGHFQIDAETATEILCEVGERVQESSVIFGVNAGEQIESARISKVATDLLQEIAISSQVKLNRNPDPEPDSDPSSVTPNSGGNQEQYFDFLSGLYNRRFLSEVLRETIVDWVRKRKSLAMLFIDVDKFKQINDNFGHAMGDNLIKHISGWLQSATRQNDFVLRLGGDEFLIAAQIKHSVCEKMCRRLVHDAPDLCTDAHERIPFSLSIGCVLYEPSRNDDVDPNWIIDRADQLMYSTKRDGGNNVNIIRIDGKDLSNLTVP